MDYVRVYQESKLLAEQLSVDGANNTGLSTESGANA